MTMKHIPADINITVLSHSQLMTAEHVSRGFSALVDCLEDLVLDVPDAIAMASIFIARAVVDDILPPAFVTHLPQQPAASCAVDLRGRCEVGLGAGGVGDGWGCLPVAASPAPLPVFLYVCLSVCLFICLSVYLSVCPPAGNQILETLSPRLPRKTSSCLPPISSVCFPIHERLSAS